VQPTIRDIAKKVNRSIITVSRALYGVQLIISDDLAGIETARKAVFTGVPWQIYQFHLQQNAGQYVPKKDMRGEVAEDIRMIFSALDRETTEVYLKKAIEKYAVIAPKLADWMEVNILEGFKVFAFLKEHQRR